ncbi:hypothetical protein AB0I00_38045 [Streptomyces sp. NPDC050803]|uniref:hypothetical protein n=1 Tax=unclassified Streptomyces TaxID=2593676 RepID=UPI00341DD1C9
MPAPATRPRRLVLAALATITAVTLGTVTASAATATDTSGSTGEPPRKGPGLAVDYRPTDGAPDDVNEANDDFAACMRGAGQTVFPDFHAEKDEDGAIRLQVRMVAAKGEDPADLFGKDHRKAIKKCAPILEEAGITLPSAPKDLPKPPAHPGKDELPELREHGEHEDGRPSLTSSV